MTPNMLLRLAGLAAVVAGVGEALNAILDFVLFPPQQSLIHTSVMSFSQQAATNAWVIQQTVNWVAKVFLLWALVGLYTRQSRQTGALGFIAFLLSFVGITLVFGAIFGYFLLAPDLAYLWRQPASALRAGAVVAVISAGLVIWSGMRVFEWATGSPARRTAS